MPEVSTSTFPSMRFDGSVSTMAVIKPRAPLAPWSIRQCREALALSQSTFSAQLGVSLETYRTWDSGRRQPRFDVLTRANELALRSKPDVLLPLETLARLIHVHVRTLHAAAKDWRLRVTYNTRTAFRRLRAQATLADAEHFLHAYFEKAKWPKERPVTLSWNKIPTDYADHIRNTRQRMQLTQAEFAVRVRCGAQGRRVPVGIAEALPFAAVLATDSGSLYRRL
jgi:DNA-binding transcriptional regulator YiaG